jgi:hypothetical protein
LRQSPVHSTAAFTPHLLQIRRDDDVEDAQRAAALDHAVERRCLDNRPREPIQHEAGFRVLAVEPLAHDADHHVIADEIAGLHRRLGDQSQFRPGLDRFPKDVSRGDLRERPALRQPLGLRALAGARGPQHDDVQALHPGTARSVASHVVRGSGSSS